MTSMSRLLQDNFCGKNSWKSIKYSQISYDTVSQLALLGFKGLSNIESSRETEECLNLTSNVLPNTKRRSVNIHLRVLSAKQELRIYHQICSFDFVKMST